MAHSVETAGESGAAAVLPPLVGTAVAAIFVLGMLLGGAAEDDYTYFAGLAFAGFSLVVGWRYFGRLLP